VDNSQHQQMIVPITAMASYAAKSFEELRLEDYKQGNKGRGGAAPAARPVDVDLVNTKERASEGSSFNASRMVEEDDFTASRLDHARDPDASGDKEAGTFTRASEETMRQRRIVSVAGRFKARSKPVEHAPDISVVVAEAKAAAKALPPCESFRRNARYNSAMEALGQAIHFGYEDDDDDFMDFEEYMSTRGVWGRKLSPEQAVTFAARWPRLRKYWPRLRRRICSYCGKGTLKFDLSEPRLMVCGGCGEGRGVGRYCSEICQREHWPKHQKTCPAVKPGAFYKITFEDMAQAVGCTVEEIKEGWAGAIVKDCVTSKAR
jgi:hypothetical protein